jgi:hypothetical protein
MHKTTLLIGVDCAVDEANIGLAIGEYRTGALEVMDIPMCSRSRLASAIVAERLGGWRAPRAAGHGCTARLAHFAEPLLG